MQKRELKLPTSPDFWRRWLEESPSIHGMMEDGDIDDAISDIINRGLKSAEQAAAIVWYMTSGLGADRQAELAEKAGDRWIDLMEIAVDELSDEERDGGRLVLEKYRADWADCCSRFVGFRRPPLAGRPRANPLTAEELAS